MNEAAGRGSVALRASAALGCIAFAAICASSFFGCGPDSSAPLACDDKDRVPPPDDTVPYSEACCSSAECAQLGSSKGVCADFGDRGHTCTHACTSDADCKGLGPEMCTSQKVCDSSTAPPPATSSE
jgi:hypothetical protein